MDGLAGSRRDDGDACAATFGSVGKAGDKFVLATMDTAFFNTLSPAKLLELATTVPVVSAQAEASTDFAESSPTAHDLPHDRLFCRHRDCRANFRIVGDRDADDARHSDSQPTFSYSDGVEPWRRRGAVCTSRTGVLYAVSQVSQMVFEVGAAELGRT